MTPDQPITLFVAVLCSTLCLVLPARYCIVPLLSAMIAYPSNVQVPPEAMQLTVQRFAGFVLFLRCVTTPEIRGGFKWCFVDTFAAAYYVLELVAQVIASSDLGGTINNRGGYFLNAMVPFWCARMLITDRQRFYTAIKGLLWTSLPLVAVGYYQAMTGDSPYRTIMENGILWDTIKFQWAEKRAFMGRTTYRASAPFGQCIMFGWLFGIQFAPATNLFWEKRKLWPWVLPWVLLPLGTINTVSAGPMSMAAMSLCLCGLFPFRKYWKQIFGTAGAIYLGITLFANRGPMELVASQGLDQSSSWYRVNLQNFTLKSGVMNGHWLAGFGKTPLEYDQYHDLCIQWIALIVTHGIMGLVGYHAFVGACAWCLWKGKQKAVTIEDHWLLWSLMCTLLATLLAMQVVSLFGEMFFLYHLFLGLVANSMLVVGQGGAVARQVGVMAELEGRPVLLRYTLQPGQKLAIVPTSLLRPAAANRRRPPQAPSPQPPPSTGDGEPQ